MSWQETHLESERGNEMSAARLEALHLSHTHTSEHVANLVSQLFLQQVVLDQLIQDTHVGLHCAYSSSALGYDSAGCSRDCQ